MSLSSFFEEYLPLVEDEMRAVVAHDDQAPPEYQEMLAYHLGWTDQGHGPAARGKRIRPGLTLLACAAAGGDPRRALPAAAAVELLHNFTLIHDDIQDDSPTRRGRPTVWRLWGRAQAINAGDAMFALAHLALQRLSGLGHAAEAGLEALRMLDATLLDLTRGQYLDIDFERRERVSVTEYMQMIEGKTAALLATAMELGALCAGAGGPARRHLQSFGRSLGLAFQIHDDILGIWGDSAVTGKSSATDIIARKKSLPIVYGLERSQSVRDYYAATTEDGGRVEAIVAALEEIGARAFAEAEARRLTAAAGEHLEQAQPEPPAGEYLRELTSQLLSRDK
jgi:geranylgeranyl diphosphate synthase type I